MTAVHTEMAGELEQPPQALHRQRRVTERKINTADTAREHGVAHDDVVFIEPASLPWCDRVDKKRSVVSPSATENPSSINGRSSHMGDPDGACQTWTLHGQRVEQWAV